MNVDRTTIMVGMPLSSAEVLEWFMIVSAVPENSLNKHRSRFSRMQMKLQVLVN
jgi:hypothetical protein